MSISKAIIENLRRKNFAPEEFLKSQKADASLKDKDPNNDIKNIPNFGQLTAGLCLADKMQKLSDAIAKTFGKRLAFNITSGFRCPELNKAVGGAPDSWHIQFLACDFNIAGLEPHEAVIELKAVCERDKISVDKVFVERGCVHMQTNMNDTKNRNFFGSAVKVNGEWIINDKIEKV